MVLQKRDDASRWGREVKSCIKGHYLICDCKQPLGWNFFYSKSVHAILCQIKICLMLIANA